MGWDLLIVDGKDAPASVQNAPSDWSPAPLGPAAQVRAQISFVIPSIDWTDPKWGTYLNDNLAIEFSLGDDPVEAIGVHVHGGGDPVSLLVALCRAQNWVAIDCSDSEFLDLEDPSSAGWTAFTAYRDKVLREYDDPVK